MSNLIAARSTHTGRLERWLGPEQLDRISGSMRNWYGPPIALAGVPGSVWAHRGGDFSGPIRAGQYMHALDFAQQRLKRIGRGFARRQASQANVGFSGLDDLIAEASAGKSRYFSLNKLGNTGVVQASNSMWRNGGQPAAGSAPAAAPGGTAFSKSSTGAFPFTNPSGGDTQHFVRSDIVGSVANTLLLYDLLFGVAKTMNSTATEAVTGVPTRYQSTTATDMDHIGGNFGFIQTGGTALAATAHNWTVCTYLDQAGAGSTLPSLTGNASGIVDRFDHPVNQWFAPLEAGDVGMQAWTQMQCSALVATGEIWFMIGHPIAFMPCPLANLACVSDGIMTAFNLTRIFDDACLAFIEVTKPATTATTYTGVIQTVAG